MGVLEDNKVTLKNGNTKEIKDLFKNEVLLSCNIKGLHPRANNNNAMSWCEKNPIIKKTTGKVINKWKETIKNYMMINNKLKISLDSIILFKDDEGITSWGYSKSLRKGYFLLNDNYEFEVIKTIK